MAKSANVISAGGIHFEWAIAVILLRSLILVFMVVFLS